MQQSFEELTLKNIEKVKLEGSTKLDLSNRQLIALRKVIGTLTNLMDLNIHSNSLVMLPREIGELINLNRLNLKSNLLITLPEEISKLTNLTTLDISDNVLKTIPVEIYRLTNLQSLNLSSNRITTLPKEIGNLINLKSLDLGSNRITTLPKEIGNLTNLETLNLSTNDLLSLPREIGKLIKLKQLILNNNKIKQLPNEILNTAIEHVGIQGLDLENNPLEIPPIEIIKQGIPAVKAYFGEIEKSETIQLFECKLLIVGQGGVGKTYLMNRLINDVIDSNAISTEGIEINSWIIKTQQTSNFRINFWDFGGQEIYHATHQFFLTKRSLYLFIWEARTDNDLLSFDYWLNTIKVLSDNSPVIVVQNKIDERKKQINQEGWKNLFPNIIDYHNVSAIEGTAVDTLRKAIIQEIEKLPHVGDLLPKRWMDIRKRLESLNENYISYSRYREICREFDMDSEKADRLSEYYHDLGIFVHFKNNYILKNTIFLNTEWVTNAVYKVIDNQNVRDDFGKFHFNDLGNIWKDNKVFPEDKYVELIELMKNFELCFELPHGQGYIIPELLRANQPELNWCYKCNLRIRYVYDFMPAGIITRFIVITHDLIKNNPYWKDGVVLNWENAKALIIKTGNRIIDVWIKGEDKKTFLGMIRRHMNYLHSSFSNLDVAEMMPCICQECHKDPYFHRYKNLLIARKKGRSYIECKKSFEPVSIEKLLGGIEDKTLGPIYKKIQKIKLFLASSRELQEERREIESFIGTENQRLYYQNIFLDLVIWENLKHSFHETRIQDHFNEKMLKSDIAVFMFFKKVGDFTKEEFGGVKGKRELKVKSFYANL